MKQFNYKSISFKLMIGGCLLTLIPLLVVGWISVSKSSKSLLHLAEASLRGTAHEIAGMVETNLKLQTEAAGAYAASGHVIQVLEKVKQVGAGAAADDLAALRQELQKVFKTLGGQYLGIFVTDVPGTLITGQLASGKEYKGPNVSKRGYFIEAKTTGKTAIGEIVRSKSTGKLIYVIASPVLSQQGEFLGIFGMSFKAETLTELVSGRKHGQTGYGWMLNRDGIFISHPNDENVLTLDATKISEMKTIVARMLDQKKGLEEYVFKGTRKLAGFAPVPIKGWSVALTQDEAEFLSVPHAIRNYILLTIAITLSMVCLLIFFGAKTITTPINTAVNKLADIAEGEGDLTTRMPVTTSDEVGQLSEKFNVFIDKLHQMISDISRGVETLSSSSTQMTAVSQELSSGSAEASEKSNSVAAAAEQMTNNMNAVAAAMEQSSANLNSVAGAAEQMNATINEIAQNAENARGISLEAVSKAGESTQKMNELSDSAKQIGQVVETITDISEQVNLLSLNATIEAARAGEAGKGFAVVANEIKDLAKQTAEASMDIKARIDSIQGSSASSLESIEQITRVISEVNDIVGGIATAVEEQSSATGEIASNIGQASAGIEEVNTNVSQSSAVAGEITQDISGVNQSASEISDRSDQVKRSAEDLSALAVRLDDLVGRFKL